MLGDEPRMILHLNRDSAIVETENQELEYRG